MVEALTSNAMGVAATDPRVGMAQEDDGERGDRVMFGPLVDLAQRQQ